MPIGVLTLRGLWYLGAISIFCSCALLIWHTSVWLFSGEYFSMKFQEIFTLIGVEPGPTRSWIMDVEASLVLLIGGLLIGLLARMMAKILNVEILGD